MAHLKLDRVAGTTTSVGVGALTLSATAVEGFTRFQDVMTDGDTTYAMIVDRETGLREGALVTYNSGAMTRTTTLSSSTGSRIDFPAGIKDIFLYAPAPKALVEGPSGDVAVSGNLTAANMGVAGGFATLGPDGQVLTSQIAGAAEGLVQATTWSALSALPGTRQGQPGRVTGADASTHTDPVVGGTVANEGEYAWSASPAGWQRVGELLNAKAVSAALAQGALGITDGSASLSSTTWTVNWSGIKGVIGTTVVAIDDVSAVALASTELLYIDLAGDTTPFQVTKATTSIGLRGDFAAGRKVQLLYNQSGVLVGPLAPFVLGVNNRAAAAAAINLGSVGVLTATASLSSTTWTVAWTQARAVWNGNIVSIDDFSDTVATTEVVYVDLVGDSNPYQPVKATTSPSLRADFAAGRKVQLLYNQVGTLLGPLAPALRLARQGALAPYAPDEIVVQVNNDNTFNVHVKASASPTSLKYIRWNVVLWQVADAVDVEGSTVDAWIIQGVHEVLRTGPTSFTVTRQLLDEGNVELAIYQLGGHGTMGGRAHGYEKKTVGVLGGSLWIDGTNISLSPVGTAYYRCKTVSLLQQSTLYQVDADPVLSVVNATVDKRYEWQNGALMLEQRVEFAQAISLSFCYLGMLPVNRVDPDDAEYDITTAAYRFAPLLTENVSPDNWESLTPQETTAHMVKLQGPNGHGFEIEAIKGWDKPNRNLSVSPETNRNKGYLDFTGTSYATTVGEVIESKVVYRFGIAG